MRKAMKKVLLVSTVVSALVAPLSNAAGLVQYLYSQDGYILAGVNGVYGYTTATDSIVAGALQTSLAGCVPIEMSKDTTTGKIHTVIYNEWVGKKTATSCPQQ